MVELIVGQKGRGKTKHLLDRAAREISEASGNVAFLDKNSEHIYELNNKIRLIDMSPYKMKSEQEFIGFILGLISQDHDLEIVLLDAFLKISSLEGSDIAPTINRLEEISKDFGVKFILSVGLDEKDIPAELKENIIVSL